MAATSRLPRFYGILVPRLRNFAWTKRRPSGRRFIIFRADLFSEQRGASSSKRCTKTRENFRRLLLPTRRKTDLFNVVLVRCENERKSSYRVALGHGWCFVKLCRVIRRLLRQVLFFPVVVTRPREDPFLGRETSHSNIDEGFFSP